VRLVHDDKGIVIDRTSQVGLRAAKLGISGQPFIGDALDGPVKFIFVQKIVPRAVAEVGRAD
jgi:hypothetical protein